MSELSIEQALDSLLVAFAARPGVGDVNLRGAIYTPTKGKPYVSGRVTGYNRVPAGLGPNCVYQVDGVYQVTVVRPTAEGKVPGGQVAAAILSAFARGVPVVTADNIRVSLLGASEQAPLDSGDWLSTPVMIRFFASEP
jgi:hypothetical protein